MPATDRTDAAFAALADPTRREIVALLARRPRPAGEIVAHFAVTQPAISRHLRVLRESGLVVAEGSHDDGRSRTYRLRPDALERIDRWVDEMRAFWRSQLGSFAAYVEEETRKERRRS